MTQSIEEVTTTKALPFEQQRRESAKAFAAFSVYLSMGPERSMAAVAQKLGKSEGLIERWGRKYDWTSRVGAYAGHLALLERKAIEGKVIEKAVEWVKMHESVKREAWKEAEETMAMVRKARAHWEKNGRIPGWEGMARMLELAFKLKQFAAGMATEKTEVTGEDGGPIRVDFEIALKRIYGEAETAPVLDVEAVPEKI